MRPNIPTHRIPSVLVVNHFAAPRGSAGGTRHIELFSRVEGWDYQIIAGNLSAMDGSRQEPAKHFKFVKVLPYRGNGVMRIMNWCSFAVTAFARGVSSPRRHTVVYGSSPHLLAALAAWAISSTRRNTFVLEVRDLWPQVLVDMGRLNPQSLIHRSLTILEEFLYAQAAHIIVMAEGTRASLLERGIPEGKIEYIPNGADPEDFHPTQPRGALRENWQFTRTTAVYAGAHGPANGLDLLLQAAKEVQDLDLDIVLVGDGVEKAALQEMAAKAKLSNVRFVDPIPKTEIGDLLAAADFGLHVLADVELFRNAVSPNKVYDYMAAGLPIVTNSPGLVTDLVCDSQCGIGVPPAALAQGIREMYGMSSSRLTFMSNSGREWIGTHQSRQAMADRLQHVLVRASNGPGSRRSHK